MLQKKYIRSRNVCKVTFALSKSQLPEDLEVETIFVVGDFNQWDPTATPLSYKKGKKAYTAVVELEPNQSYQFRYLINGAFYCNDWVADGYEPNPFGSDNCIVNTEVQSE